MALRLHDLILFDGCIIWMYEDVQGKNSRLAHAAAGDGPGVNQALSGSTERKQYQTGVRGCGGGRDGCPRNAPWSERLMSFRPAQL